MANARADRMMFWCTLFGLAGDEAHNAAIPNRKLHMTLSLLGKLTAAAVPRRMAEQDSELLQNHILPSRNKTSSLLRPTQCQGTFFLQSKSRMKLGLHFRVNKQ